jgi:hypothetical protein
MPSLSVLSPSDLDRFGKFCGMLGSAFDGERANAAAMATDLLRRNELTWWDVVKAATHKGNHTPPPPPPEEHREWAGKVLDKAAFLLNDWERDFLQSMTEWYGRPTEKQQAAIDRIKQKMHDYMRKS